MKQVNLIPPEFKKLAFAVVAVVLMYYLINMGG